MTPAQRTALEAIEASEVYVLGFRRHLPGRVHSGALDAVLRRRWARWAGRHDDERRVAELTDAGARELADVRAREQTRRR